MVALDPRDGAVLAMVSRPAFDPNLFAAHIKAADWKALTTNPDNPLLNRAIQAQFAPGSTFKPSVAMAGLETGAIDENFTRTLPRRRDLLRPLLQVLAKARARQRESARRQSSIPATCTFTPSANKIGIDSIAEYAEQAGIGKKTGIDLPGEAEGLMPSSKWKLRTQREKWYAGETISVAIGQGAVTVTPIQLASGHRRDGERRRLVQAASGEDGRPPPIRGARTGIRKTSPKSSRGCTAS